MKRRRNLRRLTPEEMAAAFTDAQAEVASQLPDRADPRRPALLTSLLADMGVDPIECIRARRSLRRHRPRGAR